MKQLIYLFSISAMLVTGIQLSGCQSGAQKVEDAQDKVETAKVDLKDAQKDAAAEAVKAANAEEIKAFKNETDLTIKNYEMQIDGFREKMKKSGKKMDKVYEEKIDILDQKIKTLKTRMSTYENTNSDWQSFKREFSHDMDELGNALKDFTVNNKK
jgi:outer membrane murein-binding lipoprotein Lpp